MPLTFSARLRDATQASHRLAERSGLMSALLGGRASRSDYARLLRNLHPIYAALECGLERHALSPALAAVRFPMLYRTQALVEDLDALAGLAWREVPVAKAATTYVARLETLVESWPAGLAAHAYVRYLGDLSGGAVLREVMRRSHVLAGGAGHAFYEYGAGCDAGAIKLRFRAGLDALQLTESEGNALVDEATDAFARHVVLFEELSPPD